MSKAEERSKEIMQAALDYANNLDNIKPTDEFRRNLCIALCQAFMKGAEWADKHQAEKDLEPTWEDIEKIYFLVIETDNEYLEANADNDYEYDVKEMYQEVLKRFNKERKEK